MLKDTGASIRIYNLAKGLSSTGNTVNVILPKNQAGKELFDGIPVEAIKGLLPLTALKLAAKFANIIKPTALYFFDPYFIAKASRQVREADIIQLEQPFLSLLILPFMQKLLRKPVVIDCHDVFQALRVKHTGLIRRILEPFLERIAYRQADLLVTVSEKEKHLLASMGFSPKKIIVAPNGVDTEQFSKPTTNLNARSKFGLADSRIVVFVGNLAYLPNREAIQLISSKIAPRVQQEISNVQFVVIGKKRDNTNFPNILFTGFVDNIAEVLSISSVGIAPLLQGSGTRLKILEYFSSGIPVVSTSVGAEGLAAKNGYEIFIDDDINGFANNVIRLLQDDQLSASVGAAGKAVAANYDWKTITRKLEVSYRQFLYQTRAD